MIDPFKREREDLIPWTAGPVECLSCGSKWAGCWPLGTEAMVCPKCRSTDTVRTDANQEELDD